MYHFNWNRIARTLLFMGAGVLLAGCQFFGLESGSPFEATAYSYRDTWGATDSSGNPTPSTGPYGYDNPFGIHIAEGGTIYIADTSNSAIKLYDSDGNHLDTWTYNVPRDIATTANHVWVTSWDSTILKLDHSGNQVAAFGGTWGTGNMEFKEPHGITLDASGNLYVADFQNHRIQKFDSNGNLLAKWGANGGDGTRGSAPGEFGGPTDVFFHDGQIYVTETGNSRVQVFRPDGTVLETFGGDAEFTYPQQITVDPKGNRYIVDMGNAVNRVRKFGSEWRHYTTWGYKGNEPGTFNSPRGIAINSEGVVYVSDEADRVQLFNPVR